jgi:membrane protease YdiL (CAAX protease family)
MMFTFVLALMALIAVVLAVAFPSIGWISPLTFVLLVPLGAVIGWICAGNSFVDLGYRFSARWSRSLAAGLLLGLAIPVLFQIIQIAGGWITLTPRAEPPGNIFSYMLLLLLKMLFLVAIEELLFRGFFIQSLSRKTGVGPAVILASLLWGAGHITSMAASGISAGQIAIGMVTFALWGVMLSICFVKMDKSLWLPYGIHLGVNLSFSLVGWFFITTPNAPQWWLGHPNFAPETGLIGIIFWSILALGVYGGFAVLARKGQRKN